MSTPGNLEELLAEAREAIAAAATPHALNEVRARFLGKKGSVSQLLRGIGGLSPEERARVGQEANRAKRAIEDEVSARRDALELPYRVVDAALLEGAERAPEC